MAEDSSTLGPLYKKKVIWPNLPDCFCLVTGKYCQIATDYFKRLGDIIKQSKEDGRTFTTKECNLCEEHNCPIYKETIFKIAEYAKNNLK